MQPNKNRDTWDRRWQGEDDSERLTVLGRRMLAAKQKAIGALLHRLPPDIRVLEVGCGLGYTLSPYLDAKLDCLGIDISARAVQACREKGLPVRLQSLEETEESYDLVASDGMLEHFLCFEPMARQMVRISKGYVLLLQPNRCSHSGRTLAFLAETLRADVNVYEYNYRIGDFISVFEALGCSTLVNEPVFFDVFRLLLFKKNEEDADKGA